jgi:UDP-N-acetylglucosamine 2-epimerase (non-hydrolysing)
VRDAVRALPAELPYDVDPAAPYVVATIHRAENTDDPQRLDAVVEALAGIPVQVVLLAHPRLRARAAEFGIALAGRGSVHTADPLPYPQMVRAVLGSAGVVTDSGGLQKEAFLLGAPCTTLRTETEWTETLLDGWNMLDPTLSQVAAMAARPAPSAQRGAPYGDGKAALRVAEELLAPR